MDPYNRFEIKSFMLGYMLSQVTDPVDVECLAGEQQQVTMLI